MESGQHTPAAPYEAKCEAASNSEGRRFYSFGLTDEDRRELRTLLCAFLCDKDVSQHGTKTFDLKDESPISSGSSDGYDSSDETSTTGSDLSDDEFAGNDFSDDDDE